MRKLRALLLRLRGLAPTAQAEHDLQDEIGLHIDLETEANEHAGIPHKEARRQAMLKVGGEQVMQAVRDRRSLPALESLLQDTRFALRQLRTHPTFTATAITMMVLGIAASVSIFAFVDATLLRPLPYREPRRLVATTELVDKLGPANLSYQDYLDWRRSNRVYQSFAAWGGEGFLLATPGGTEPVTATKVTANFFGTLGVPPLLGRDFRPGEDLAGAPRTVILTYPAWQQYFGGRADVIDSSVRLSGEAFTIIGVLPQNFEFAARGPSALFVAMHPTGECELRRSCHNLIGLARLKDGITVAQADGDVKRVARELQQQYPGSNRGQDGIALPLYEQVVHNIRPILLTFLAGSGLLLLIACINVASLLLARADSRRREFALRGALGAPSGRIFRQFATESLLLVLIGTLLGVASAATVMRLLLSLIPAKMLASMPYLKTAHLTGRVLTFTVAISVAAWLLFTLIPALHVSFTGLRAGLMEGTSGGGSLGWRRLGSNLVVLELATAVVLLAGAGLLGRSLFQLLRVHVGFDPSHLATIFVEAPETSYPGDEKQLALQKQVEARFRTLPGVQAVGIANLLPVSFNGNTGWIRFVGRPYDGHHIEVNERTVSPQYFETLRATLLHGRWFTEADAPQRRSGHDHQSNLRQTVFSRRGSDWEAVREQ